MNSFTPNYNLDLYDVDDKPNLNDQYNAAMTKVDNELSKQAGDIVTAETAVANLTTKVEGYDGRITANTDAIATNTADITKLQTDVATAQTTAENGVTAAHEANELAVQASSAAQTAQTTADGAMTKANANATAISAETAARTSADTNLQTQINEIKNKGTGSGVGTAAMRKATFVFVGDSYAQAETPSNTWTGQIKNIVGNAATYYNAAVSGGGFTTDVRFQQQIVTQANKMNTTQRNAVDYVIIAGGRNDIGSQSETVLINAATDCVNAAATNFPNATIVVVPMLWDDGVQQSSFDYVKANCYILGAVQAVNKNVVIPVNWAWTWLKGIRGAVQSDGVHPNSKGANIIANYILSAINGSYSGRVARYLYADNNINIEFTCNAGTVMCRTWAGNSPAFPSGGIANAIPEACRPVADVSTVGYTNSGTSTGIMQYTRAGTFNIYQKSGALGGVQGNTTWAW